MLLSSNSPARGAEYQEVLVLHLLQTGHYAQAYQLLMALKTSTKVEVHFNLALCYMSINKYDSALHALDQAQTLLRIPLGAPKELNDAEFRAMTVQQNRTNCYKYAISSLQLEYFPEMLRDNIIRLKVDCFLMLEQWQQVLTTAALVQNKQYKNVDDAITIAQEKLKK